MLTDCQVEVVVVEPAASPENERPRFPIESVLELRLEGMVTVRDGLPTMFNPRYEILSRQEEQ